MASSFSFDNAAFHFARTEGPKGFVWKYLLTYALGAFCLSVAGLFLMRPVFEMYAEVFALIGQGVSDEYVLESVIERHLLDNLGPLLLGYLAFLALGVVFWSIMEAAILRRYVRDAGFSIGFGADELRMIAVGLLWFVMFLGLYLGFTLAAMGLILPVTSIARDNPSIVGFWTLIVMLALGFLWLYLTVRLSPAGALTIRDRKVKFFDAWSATRGRFWTLLGAFLLIGIMLYVVYAVIAGVGVFSLAGTLVTQLDPSMGDPDPSEVVAVLTSPGLVGLVLGFVLLMLLLQATWQYIWAGIPAMIAKAEHRQGGHADAAAIFD